MNLVSQEKCRLAIQTQFVVDSVWYRSERKHLLHSDVKTTTYWYLLYVWGVPYNCHNCRQSQGRSLWHQIIEIIIVIYCPCPTFATSPGVIWWVWESFKMSRVLCRCWMMIVWVVVAAEAWLLIRCLGWRGHQWPTFDRGFSRLKVRFQVFTMFNDWFQRKLISFSETQNEQVLAFVCFFKKQETKKYQLNQSIDILIHSWRISWVPFPGAPIFCQWYTWPQWRPFKRFYARLRGAYGIGCPVGPGRGNGRDRKHLRFMFQT